MNPGMMLRIDQSSIDGFKHGMSKFLPHFLTSDYELPKEWEYDFGFFADFLTYHVGFSNITYGSPKLDIANITFEVTRDFDRPLITADFPAIKEWFISAT